MVKKYKTKDTGYWVMFRRQDRRFISLLNRGIINGLKIG